MLLPHILLALTGCNSCDTLSQYGYRARGTCPTELKLAAEASVTDVERGSLGTLTVQTWAEWMEDRKRTTHRRTERYDRDDLKITARLEGTDAEVVLTAFEKDRSGQRTARITIPQVPDGDHTLVLELDAGFDQAEVRVPLAFYDPALVHVISDRPLYRPGEDVRLRSLLMARADYVPLGERPGRWIVRAPDGAELLNEVDRAGPWGVAATSLPLDAQAPVGTYTATYRSGRDEDSISFEVKPFELPKLTMDLTPSRSWSGRGDEVAARGTARYRSGAPVANAPVTVRLRSSAAWPLPLAWTEAKQVKTDANGRYTVSWGAVPKDLRGRAELVASATVTDEGGERTGANTSLVLSEFPVQAVALTELETGLAPNANNRAYIRVLTPDGIPLAKAEVTVSNPWVPTQKPKVAMSDEDGVVALQLDPGDPVTLVDEPMPVRVRPAPPPKPADAPSVTGLTGSFRRPLDLTEQRALPMIERLARRCQHVQQGQQRIDAALRTVDGRITGLYAENPSPTLACLDRVLSGQRLPLGTDTYDLDLAVPDSLRPWFDLRSETAVGSTQPVEGLLTQAAGEARSCLEPGRGEDRKPALTAHWSVSEEQRSVAVDVQLHDGSGLSGTEIRCVTSRLRGLRLDDDAERDHVGSTQLMLRVPTLPGAPKPRPKPQPVTRDGFRLTVAVEEAGRLVGSAPLDFEVGAMPPVRLRATPPVVAAGEAVVFEVLRSGDQAIDLPEELGISQHGKEVTRTKLNGNQAVFTLPPATNGFLDVSFRGAKAKVYVERGDRLALTLSPDQATYRPGDEAVLTLKTTKGGQGTKAAVGLIGVDAALGQLAPLPGPDDVAKKTLNASSSRPAFGSFDAHALLLGRIRGTNARQAAVLRVDRVRTDRFDRPKVSGSGARKVDQQLALDRAFEQAYAATAARVRSWERGAPEGEKLDHRRMLKLWREGLEELRAQGTPAEDAFGRELRLRLLPQEMLEQLDPRLVVGDATRIPEDSENWVSWVAEEVTDG